MSNRKPVMAQAASGNTLVTHQHHLLTMRFWLFPLSPPEDVNWEGSESNRQENPGAWPRK